MNCSIPGSSVHHYLLEFAKFMSTEWVMLSEYLIFCRPLLLLPSTFPSIRVFSSESALCIKLPKNWSFSFSISPNEYLGLISFSIGWFDLCCPRDSQESSPIPQLESINSSAHMFTFLPYRSLQNIDWSCLCCTIGPYFYLFYI